jgi:hypothetical protein
MSFAPLSAWRSKAAGLRLLRRTLQVFGVFWLVLEPLALWQPDKLDWGISGYLALLLASIFISVFWAWPKTFITRKLPLSDTQITVQVGDLLKQDNNIIIGTNDVFDTELGDVVSPSSVQGQFQKQFFPNTAELDDLIANALANVESTLDPSKIRGKKDRYPIGTVAVVRSRGNRYFLSAYSRMGSNLQCKSDICKLTTSLESCWGAIRVSGQHEPVHMAIVGSSLSRTGLSRALLLQFIILSFLDEERKASVTNHLFIYVHKSDMGHIDFVDLEDWMSGLTRAV